MMPNPLTDPRAGDRVTATRYRWSRPVWGKIEKILGHGCGVSCAIVRRFAPDVAKKE